MKKFFWCVAIGTGGNFVEAESPVECLRIIANYALAKVLPGWFEDQWSVYNTTVRNGILEKVGGEIEGMCHRKLQEILSEKERHLVVSFGPSNGRSH